MPRSNEKVLEVVKHAFLTTHQGYSTDEVLISDELNEEFIKSCKLILPSLSSEQFNWWLMNLRKRGKVTTRRNEVKYEDFLHAGEIAARLIYDKHQVSVDRALCNPELRREFDTIAASVSPGVSPYVLRKAALRLRKARRLRPELVLRVAAWSSKVVTLTAEEILEDPTLVPMRPGVYIFRDSLGYLYIGESENLHLRVRKHLDHSDSKSLAHYLWDRGIRGVTVELHVFDPQSDGRLKNHRRAYESSLIESRNPRFNILP